VAVDESAEVAVQAAKAEATSVDSASVAEEAAEGEPKS
jgi:hypothetical protein